jgi:hypothetical protein
VLDLLSETKKKIIPREDARKKVILAGLTELPVRGVDDLMAAIEGGSAQRSTSMTGMNEQSSRSHAILQMSMRSAKGKLHGQLSFIDLAGSEKGSDTAENEKKTRMEGAEINKSLLALKECIRSMTDPNSGYTPFRSSKLTQVLKESFVGNGRTVMIANISPAAASCGETVNTLRYADRVKAIGKGGGGGARAAAAPAPGSSALNSSASSLASADLNLSDLALAPPKVTSRKGGKAPGAAPLADKENVGNTGPEGVATRRRQSHLALGGGRYQDCMQLDSGDEPAEPEAKKRRSLVRGRRAPSREAAALMASPAGSDAPECSFTSDHDDEGFVFQGEPAAQPAAQPAAGKARAPAPAPGAGERNPVEFVDSFRSQIERSMQLIEQEVRGLPAPAAARAALFSRDGRQ